MKTNQIEILARQFRCAIEEVKNSLWLSHFSDFPLGCCGDTCDLLGAFLSEQGFTELEYVWGYNGVKTHAWLECKGQIIDITGDQFSDSLPPIYVGPYILFYRKFSEIKKSELNSLVWPLILDYKTIKKNIR